MEQIAYREPKSNAGKPVETAARLGQVFTPNEIADVMASQLLAIGSFGAGTAILDPCIGRAALPAALLRAGLRDFSLVACELDSVLAESADSWIQSNMPGNSPVIRADYFQHFGNSEVGFDAAIANPPYIRQEWIDNKATYQQLATEKWGVSIPGTSNLYVYFIVGLILGLRPGGVFSVVVYDSWYHTKFGRWLVDFMNSKCESIISTHVSGAPFEDKLIDATILTGRRETGNAAKQKSLSLPEKGLFRGLEGFVPISTEYGTKRGLRLKQASFFIGGTKDISKHGAIRFAKKPAKVTGFCVPEDHPESALLLPLNGYQDPRTVAELAKRLQIASENPEANQSILNWYAKRPAYWNRHPEPPQAPVLFNYYFRKRPKHLLSPSSIRYADNYYGVIPENGMSPAASFALLNSTAVCLELEAHSRKQGNGLHKLQLFEYRGACVPGRNMFVEADLQDLENHGQRIARQTSLDAAAVRAIDEIVYRASEYSDALQPELLDEKINNIWGRR